MYQNLTMLSTVDNRPKEGCCNLTIRDWMKFISNLAIPLIIGIFTISIAVHQQNLAQANRDKDIAELIRRRTEDLVQEQKRREEDKELARQQRDDAKKAATAQLIEDRETARLQRELDWKIAEEKLKQEYELAEQQRTLSLNQREHEFQVTQQNHENELLLEDERIKNTILLNYQRDIAKILQENSVSYEKADTLTQSVIYMKTRAALRLLDPMRRTIVIHTLIQVNLFRSEQGVMWNLLYRTNVSGVQFGRSNVEFENHDILSIDFPNLNEADARNASFRSVAITNSPWFHYSNFDFTDWSFSRLKTIKYIVNATMNNAIFYESLLENIEFEGLSMNYVSFKNNKNCVSCSFLDTSMKHAQLNNARFNYSIFERLSLFKSNLSNSYFNYTMFEKISLEGSDLSDAVFQRCSFRFATITDCRMSNTIFNETEFSIVDFTGCTGFKDHQIDTILITDYIILPNGTLLSSSQFMLPRHFSFVHNTSHM